MKLGWAVDGQVVVPVDLVAQYPRCAVVGGGANITSRKPGCGRSGRGRGGMMSLLRAEIWSAGREMRRGGLMVVEAPEMRRWGLSLA